MELNKIYNEDCIKTMEERIDPNSVDLVLTSPPYGTCKVKGSMKKHSKRYEEYDDMAKSNEEYIDWTIEIFKGFDKILKPTGIVLYNISYGSENSDLMWLLIAELIKRTNFKVADCIIWKKKSALPNNTSTNTLTRICEFVFVFCRKSEYSTFHTNKELVSTRANGQHYYSNIFNYIEAANNDETLDFHKATYSTELCRKLLVIYGVGGGGGYFVRPIHGNWNKRDSRSKRRNELYWFRDLS